jgi:hypothetical protein
LPQFEIGLLASQRPRKLMESTELSSSFPGRNFHWSF